MNTFTYTDSDGVSEITGTFTDWIIEKGPQKTKKFDSTLGYYVWNAENVADGTETNINQIDIAISKGEKVEIKVRSISEAGYPENPLRSEWSNSVIIEFPSTLATGNEVADLITMVNDDAINLSILNTLQSMGVDTHLDDTVPNTNSLTGVYFKHLAENIAYEEGGVDENGISVVNSISLQKKIDSMLSSINSLNSTNGKNGQDIAAIQTEMTSKHTAYEQNILDLSTGSALLNVSVNMNTRRFSEFIDSENHLFTDKLLLTNEAGKRVVGLSSMNQNELFVIDQAIEGDGSLGDVHVKNLYVHPDGITTSERVSLYDTYVRVDELSKQNSDLISSVNSSIRSINTKLVDMATLQQISELDNKIAGIVEVDTCVMTDDEEEDDND